MDNLFECLVNYRYIFVHFHRHCIKNLRIWRTFEIFMNCRWTRSLLQRVLNNEIISMNYARKKISIRALIDGAKKRYGLPINAQLPKQSFFFSSKPIFPPRCPLALADVRNPDLTTTVHISLSNSLEFFCAGRASQIFARVALLLPHPATKRHANN